MYIFDSACRAFYSPWRRRAHKINKETKTKREGERERRRGTNLSRKVNKAAKGTRNRPSRGDRVEHTDWGWSGVQVPVPVAAIKFYLSSSFKEFRLAFSVEPVARQARITL